MFKNLLLATIVIGCQTPNIESKNIAQPKNIENQTILNTQSGQTFNVNKNYNHFFGSSHNAVGSGAYSIAITETETQNNYAKITTQIIVSNNLFLPTTWNTTEETPNHLLGYQGLPHNYTQITILQVYESFNSNTAQIKTDEAENILYLGLKDKNENTYNINLLNKNYEYNTYTIEQTKYNNIQDNLYQIKNGIEQNIDQNYQQIKDTITQNGTTTQNHIGQYQPTTRIEGKNKVALLLDNENSIFWGQTDFSKQITAQQLNFTDDTLENIVLANDTILDATNYDEYKTAFKTIEGTDRVYRLGYKTTTYTEINNRITIDINATNTSSEIIDIPSLMFDIIAMPFAFIRQAFNVTIFAGTPYQFNFANAFMAVIAILSVLFIVKLFTHGIDALGTYTGSVGKLTDRHNKNQMQKKQLKQEDRKIAETERHNKAMEGKKDK